MVEGYRWLHMRTIITLVPMVLLISGVLALTVGGTLATFSDSEISQDNYIETGSRYA